MAKRTPPSQADDSATATPPKARPNRSRQSASGAAETFIGSPDAPGQTTPDQETSERPDARVDEGRPATRSSSMGSEPSEEDIRMRAYHRYIERGGGDGMHFEDWLEAERELKSKQDAE
jgi:hypothetical protein